MEMHELFRDKIGNTHVDQNFPRAKRFQIDDGLVIYYCVNSIGVLVRRPKYTYGLFNLNYAYAFDIYPIYSSYHMDLVQPFYGSTTRASHINIYRVTNRTTFVPFIPTKSQWLTAIKIDFRSKLNPCLRRGSEYHI